MLNYSAFGFQLTDLLYYLFIYSFIGWVIETVYSTLEEGHFVNRGFLMGPFCPIYGFGSVALILSLSSVVGNIVWLFLGAMVITSVLEYITGIILEKSFHHKWWDYSNRPFNINGRICLRFSVYWGLLAVVLLRIIHPVIVNVLKTVPIQYGQTIIYVLITYSLGDLALTLISVIQFNSLLKEIHQLRLEGQKRLQYLRQTSVDGLEEALIDFRIRHESLLAKMESRHQRIIQAFPSLKSIHYQNALMDIKDRLREAGKHQR